MQGEVGRCENNGSPGDPSGLVSHCVYTMVYHGTLQLVRPPEDTFHRSTIPDAVKALKRSVQQTVVDAPLCLG